MIALLASAFEDAAGSEEVYLQAQKDYNELIKNNHTTTVKANQTNDVAGDQCEHVGGHRTIHVGGSQTITVDGTKPAGGIQGAALRVMSADIPELRALVGVT